MIIVVKSQVTCGTPQNGIVQGFRDINNTNYSNTPICINVQFHIVRDSNGSGGVSNAFVDQIVNLLNSKFNQHNIYIRNAGVDYINNSNFYNTNDSYFSSIVATNNNPNAINFYLVNSCSNWAGRAEQIVSRNLVIVNSYAQTGVSAHELGHCINLWHTFHGSPAEPSSGSCAEAINGSNCNSCGDYVCDTPADANVGATQGYNPDLTNIMSYSPPANLDHFTSLQGVRMRDALDGSPVLQQVKSNLCGGITGESIICPNISSTFSISNPNNYQVFWSVNSNLSVVGTPTNSSIVVKSATSTTSGMGVITATINGSTFNYQVWVGKPNIEVQLNSNSNYVDIDLISGEGNNITLQGINSTTWTKTASTNNGQAGGSGFSGFGHGPNLYWTVTLKITASNSCGTTEITRVITPAPPGPCNETLKLTKISKNNYEAIIIDPCSGSNTTSTSKQINTDNPITTELINMSGVRVAIFNKNKFDLNKYNKGYYIIVVTKNSKKIVQKILIE